MMQVRMLSETDAWAAGTSAGKEAIGSFYKTTDGGKSWAKAQEVPLSSPIGMDCFDNQHCIAPAVLPITQECTVLTYKPAAAM